ncbi:hypothetical protein [Thermaerobacter subterraneus]|uniref:hypothetical protein n=1 Tax=Thermaerobacter subterraneus TaxID=175696 RepID=UPI00031BA2D5|nr:hypothetical protein [Thermaerobacter subterraneus]
MPAGSGGAGPAGRLQAPRRPLPGHRDEPATGRVLLDLGAGRPADLPQQVAAGVLDPFLDRALAVLQSPPPGR